MKDRLNLFLEKEQLTATKFASVIDVNPSAISHLLNGRNKPGAELLVKILEAFPALNINWLLTGNGNIYTNQSNVENNATHRSIEKEAKTDLSEDNRKETFPIALPISGRRIKRIVLFFEDGEFEDYLSS